MSYKVKTIKTFEKEVRKLLKKYRSLTNDVIELIETLKENPKQGVDIGQNCFKIRLAIKSKGKGKSSGARVITYFTVTDETVYLLSIYDKSEKDNIKDSQIRELLDELPKM